jgi:hypothetical protein
MKNKIEDRTKRIETLLLALIITTAATAGLVALVMIQWVPVATYYTEGIAEEAAYESEYEDEMIEEDSDELEEEDVTTVDENGEITEDDVTITDEEDATEDTTSEGATQ